MAICPHCQTKSKDVLDPCPSGDGYYCVDESDYAENRDDDLFGVAVGGRFVVESLLGTGSMAHVYRAHQLEVDRTVALKVFRTDDLFDTAMVGDDRERALDVARQRFAQEARVLGKLAHPNCVTLFDFGTNEERGYLYIAMEYVGGISLRRAINRGLKLEAIYEIVQQVLLALREAHSLSIVHRDLKPENIILSFRHSSDEAVVKVVDFGIAKLLGREKLHTTNVGALFGTPAYMSPEQCRGEVSQIGAHSDVYALGCILYEMVCGRLPFESSLPIKMLRMHVENPSPPVQPRAGLDPHPGLGEFIDTCLKKAPQARYPDAQAALAALGRIVDEVDSAGTSTDRLRRRATSKLGGRSARVVVPENQISGVDIGPPMRAQPGPADSGEPVSSVAAVEVERQPPDATGRVEYDTHSRHDQPGGASRTAEDAIGPLVILLALVFLVIAAGLLFYFMWEMI